MILSYAWKGTRNIELVIPITIIFSYSPVLCFWECQSNLREGKTIFFLIFGSMHRHKYLINIYFIKWHSNVFLIVMKRCMTFQSCRTQFIHYIHYNIHIQYITSDISVPLCWIEKCALLYLLNIVSLYAIKVLSDGQLSKEVYKIIDKLDIF